jgi:hypothetical protein
VGDVLNDSLERKLSDQEISGLLVLSDFSESDGTWSVSVWLLDTSGNWGALSGGLAGDVLSWSLNSGGALSSGSLSSGHFVFLFLYTNVKIYGFYSKFQPGIYSFLKSDWLNFK